MQIQIQLQMLLSNVEKYMVQLLKIAMVILQFEKKVKMFIHLIVHQTTLFLLLVDGDNKKTTADLNLTSTLKSNSVNVTAITTYLTSLSDDQISEVSSKFGINKDDLSKIPSTYDVTTLIFK